ncbi:MAG: hypothetical protein IJ493_03330 [Clostridia bacterium]|nr:hypothetical protein [Clostridia bacterium]
MKKTVSTLLTALLIAVSAALPASAAGAEDWVAGNGFLIDGKASGVKVVETDDGVQVTEGGYYTNGENWSGIASKEKLALDGLEVVVRFDKVTKSGDCWISFGLMENPELFRVSDVKNGRGYACLIRHGTNPIGWQHYQLVDTTGNKWSGDGSQNLDASFQINDGTTLTISVKKGDNGYDLYLNGVKSNKTFTQYNDIFADGKAHFVLAASSKDSAADAFTFTILSVNGQPTVSAEEPEQTTAPETFDPITVSIIAVSASAAAVFAVSKKRK